MPLKIWPDIILPTAEEMLIRQVARKHGLWPWQLRGGKRIDTHRKARREFAYKASKLGFFQKEIAYFLNRERSTISTLINNYEKNKTSD